MAMSRIASGKERAIARSTPRASMPVVPRSLKPLLQQARQTITKQQQAITTLQADMADLHTRCNAAPTPQVPPSAAPEKCDLEMTPNGGTTKSD
ncbi:hypothetical protein E2C01_053985 [Portunus trituberculatus]|uniref:Uncharacterized protein n=1 Tax=Portunus trituberculatus TaxID=210409 RepID=A0A5B7GLX5_PORTR|nr:hypothetical protein [Portunus trituberculatus]